MLFIADPATITIVWAIVTCSCCCGGKTKKNGFKQVGNTELYHGLLKQQQQHDPADSSHTETASNVYYSNQRERQLKALVHDSSSFDFMLRRDVMACIMTGVTHSVRGEEQRYSL